MNKFILFLVIIFIVGFIVQQSNFFENKKVVDIRLGETVDEYHLNWNNLYQYVHDIPKKIKKMIPAKSPSQ